MKAIQTRRSETLGRVVEFGEQYGHLFPKSSEAEETFEAVAAAYKQIGDQTRSRLATDRAAKQTRTITRAAVYERLDAMARAARAIGESTPGFELNFELSATPADHELIGAGRLFMEHAESVKKAFIAKAFPATFIADITELIDAFEQAVRDRDAKQVENANARAAIDHALDVGFAAVRTLDIMMRAALKDDATLMRTWDKTRRVVYPKQATPPAPVATTTPAPVGNEPPVIVAPVPAPAPATPPAALSATEPKVA